MSVFGSVGLHLICLKGTAMSNSEFCSIYVLDMALGNLSAKVQPVFLFFFFFCRIVVGHSGTGECWPLGGRGLGVKMEDFVRALTY